MKLVIGYRTRDIKDYEFETGKNIIGFFEKLDITTMLELISLGNGRCSIEEASDKLDEYLMGGKDYLDAVYDIKELLVGKRENDVEEIEDGEVDISEFSKLSSLYSNYGRQLTSTGLGFNYNDIWDMDTEEMYEVFNSLEIAEINRLNRRLREIHDEALMNAAATWGKLPKEAPQIDVPGKEEQILEHKAKINKVCPATQKILDAMGGRM